MYVCVFDRERERERKRERESDRERGREGGVLLSVSGRYYVFFSIANKQRSILKPPFQNSSYSLHYQHASWQQLISPWKNSLKPPKHLIHVWKYARWTTTLQVVEYEWEKSSWILDLVIECILYESNEKEFTAPHRLVFRWLCEEFWQCDFSFAIQKNRKNLFGTLLCHTARQNLWYSVVA